MTEKIKSKDTDERETWVLRQIYRLSRRTKPPYPPKVNDRVGSWTILSAWTSQKGFLMAFKCQCDCGHIEEYVNTNNLKSGASQQCRSCSGSNQERSELYGKWNDDCFPKWYTDDHKRILRNRLSGMIERCKGDHHMNMNITVYQEWIDNPKTFVDYITTQFPSWDEEDLIPDRINTYDGYKPGNIRFVTRVENSRNRTDTKYITYEGKEIDIMTFAQNVFGLERSSDNRKLYNAIYAQAKRGQSGELIIKYCKMKKLC